MRVIIVGASKVAYSLINQINNENVDIVIVDISESAIDKITDAFDCNGFVGNGGSPALLKKAGIEAASLFVALTKSDETNILCCNVAKKLGVKRTVAAVRRPEYKEDKAFMTEEMGVDVVINPDMAAAHEVNKIIKYTKEVEIEHFGETGAAVATVSISNESVLANVKMPEIQERIGASMLVCGIDRNNKIIVPKGNQTILPGDKVTFAAIGDNMDKVLSKLNIMEYVVKNVAIIGAGKIGCYLAQILSDNGVKVTLIEKNSNQCNCLLESLPKVNIICGDGTDAELLEQELKGKDACVIMTGSDEENLIISMFAKSMGMERIAAEIDNAKYDEMLKKSGVKHTFSTQDVSIGTVVRDLRALFADEDENDNNVIEWFYSFNGGKIEAVEFELTEEFPLIGIEFKDPKFSLKNGVLVVAIVRDGKVIIPDGNSSLCKGDRVIVISAEHKINKLTEIIA